MSIQDAITQLAGADVASSLTGYTTPEGQAQIDALSLSQQRSLLQKKIDKLTQARQAKEERLGLTRGQQIAQRIEAIDKSKYSPAMLESIPDADSLTMIGAASGNRLAGDPTMPNNSAGWVDAPESYHGKFSESGKEQARIAKQMQQYGVTTPEEVYKLSETARLQTLYDMMGRPVGKDGKEWVPGPIKYDAKNDPLILGSKELPLNVPVSVYDTGEESFGRQVQYVGDEGNTYVQNAELAKQGMLYEPDTIVADTSQLGNKSEPSIQEKAIEALRTGSWINEKEDATFIDKSANIGKGIAHGMASVAASISEAPKKLYELLGGDYLEPISEFAKENPTYSKVVKSVIDTMADGSAVINALDKKYIGFDDTRVKKLQKEFGDAYDTENYITGMLGAIVTNPVGAVELASESFAFSKAMAAKGIVAVPAVLGTWSDNATEAAKIYEKEYGLKPEGEALRNIAALSALGTLMDMAQAKLLFDKSGGTALAAKTNALIDSLIAKVPTTVAQVALKGTSKLATLIGTEFTQEGATEATTVLGGTQDLDRALQDKYIKQVYKAAAGGAASGPGMKAIDVPSKYIPDANTLKEIPSKLRSTLTPASQSDGDYVVSAMAESSLQDIMSASEHEGVKKVLSGEIPATEAHHAWVDHHITALNTELDSMPDSVTAKTRDSVVDGLANAVAMKAAMARGKGTALNSRPLGEIEADVVAEQSKDTPDEKALFRLSVEKEIAGLPTQSPGTERVSVSKESGMSAVQSHALKFYGGRVDGQERTGLLTYIDALENTDPDSKLYEYFKQRLNHFIDTQKVKLDKLETAKKEYDEKLATWDQTGEAPSVELGDGKVYDGRSEKGLLIPQQKEFGILSKVGARYIGTTDASEESDTSPVSNDTVQQDSTKQSKEQSADYAETVSGEPSSAYTTNDDSTVGVTTARAIDELESEISRLDRETIDDSSLASANQTKIEGIRNRIAELEGSTLVSEGAKQIPVNEPAQEITSITERNTEVVDAAINKALKGIMLGKDGKLKVAFRNFAKANDINLEGC